MSVDAWKEQLAEEILLSPRHDVSVRELRQVRSSLYLITFIDNVLVSCALPSLLDENVCVWSPAYLIPMRELRRLCVLENGVALRERDEVIESSENAVDGRHLIVSRRGGVFLLDCEKLLAFYVVEETLE